jgi:DNA modification methylase
MPEINLDQIIPPKSDYKYDSEEFERLKSSIKDHGLFHDIILQQEEYTDKYHILAGRARFLAWSSLTSEPIRATLFAHNCPNPQEIALHENLRRNNLPWYDQCELEKELHELRIAEHGKKKEGRPFEGSTEKKGWSQNDTARELGLALGTFSQDMQLAHALRENPQLRNIKDKTTALKVIKNVVKRSRAEEEQFAPSELTLNEILLGDSRIILKTFPENTFNCCITDPPWSEYYRDEELRADQDSLLGIFFELYRVLKQDSFLFVVTSSTDFPFYQRELPKLGFKVQSWPLIWNKPKHLTHGRAAWQFARDYEPLIVAVKGNPSLTSGTEISSILRYDNLHYTKMIHPHEKPIELIEALIKYSTYDGAKIIDPFAGSGVVLEACKKNDRKFIGIEKEKKFYDLIVGRLKEKK